MELRPSRWVLILALALAGFSFLVAGWALPIARWLIATGLPIFPGLQDAAYYGSRLRVTALAWGLVFPVFAVTAAALRRAWTRSNSHGDRGAPWPPWPVALWLLVILAVVAAVPRERTGDEPSYLAMARAVATRGSLVLTAQDGDAHLSLASKEPRSVHSAGISLLVAAPMALLGQVGVLLALALLSFGFLLYLWKLLAAVVGEQLAGFVAVLLAASFPVVAYSALVLPEMAGAFGLILLHWRLVHKRQPDLGCAAALAWLPWLHVRFLAGAAIYCLYGLLRAEAGHRRRAIGYLLVPLGASLLAMAYFHQRWFGSPSPLAMWGNRHGLIVWSESLAGSLGVLVDQQYGLLFWAPIMLLVPLGFIRCLRRAREEALLIAVIIAATAGPGILHQWWAGWSPGARFLVPVTGHLALLAALGLEQARQGHAVDRLLAGLAATGQLLLGLVSALVPGKAFGTFEAIPRNYFLDLLGRFLHAGSFRSTLCLRAAHGWGQVALALLLVVGWLVGSLRWARRLDRLSPAGEGHD